MNSVITFIEKYPFIVLGIVVLLLVALYFRSAIIDFIFNHLGYLFVGFLILELLSAILVKMFPEKTTLNDVIEYSQSDYADYYYDPDSYVSETDFYDASEEVQESIRQAYIDGFEEGVQNTLSYLDYLEEQKHKND